MATNVSTIGSGKDYSDWETWEAATDINLVAAGDIEVAEVHDNDTNAHTAAGATTDASNYRESYPVAGSEWDPIAATGITLSGSAFYTFRTSSESFFRLSGFHINQDLGVGAAVLIAGDDTLIERCDIHMGSNDHGMQLTSTATVRNCLFRTDTANTSFGIYVTASGGIGSSFHNCVMYDWQRGLRFNVDDVAATEIRNCAAVDNSSSDYFSTGSTASGTYSHNLSSDTTAFGTSSQKSESATDTFVDPANDDFTMKAGSAAIDNGVDLSGTFTEDFNGDTRTGTWDIGVYFDAAAVSPPFLPALIRRRTLNPILVR